MQRGTGVGRALVAVVGLLASLTAIPPVAAAATPSRLSPSLAAKLAASTDDHHAEFKVIARFARPVDDGLAATLPGVRYRYRHLPAVALTLPADALQALAARPDVHRIDEDATVELAPPEPADMSSEPSPPPDQGAAEADLGFADAQATFDLDGDAANDGITKYGVDDIVVAVIDSGIDTRHVDLAGGKVLAFRDFVTEPDASCPPVPVPARPFDQLGHGTHVSSIIAGTGAGNPRYRGLAPGAALVGLKVFDCRNTTTMSMLDEAFEWILDHRAALRIKVANLSVGAAIPGARGTDTTSILVNQLTAAGVVVTVAAGNSGPSSGSVTTPGVATWALTAGALGGDNRGRFLTVFSGRGPVASGRTKPDVLAPGGDITAAYAAGDQTSANTHAIYQRLSGTSMASPFLAGLSALALQANPARAPSGTACSPTADTCPEGVVASSMSVPVHDLVRSSSQDWGRPGPDAEHGWGAVRAFSALAAAKGSAAAGPAYPIHLSRSGSLAGTGDRQVWAFEVTDASRPVYVSMDSASSSGYGFADVDVFGPNGVVILTGAQCASMCAELPPTTSGFQGGWFVPSTAGIHYVVVRSQTGAGAYDLDLENVGKASTDPRPPAVVVAPGTRLVEGGPPATLSVALGRAPSGPVTLRIGNDSGLSVSPTELTFTPSSWSTAQTVSVAAPSNGVIDGVHTAGVTLVSSSAAVADATFAELSLPVADDGQGSATGAQRINVTPAGGQSDRTTVHGNDEGFPSLSGDGRFVLFQTPADDLLPGATGGVSHGYLRDRKNARTERVTLAPDGSPLTGRLTVLGMSDDADRILFSVSAAGEAALPGDTNGDTDLYVRDRSAGTTTRVTLTSTGAPMPGQACGSRSCAVSGVISGDGSRVAFVTRAPMVSGDTDTTADVYVRNLDAATTTRASVNDAGVGGTGGDNEVRVVLDRTGTKVFFTSTAEGLAPGHVHRGASALYLRDLTARTTRLVGVDGAGNEVPFHSWAASPVASGNGRYVAFTAYYPEGGWYGNLYLRDVAAGTSAVVGRRYDGSISGNDVHALAIDDGGAWIDFTSWDLQMVSAVSRNYGAVRHNLATNANTPLVVDRVGEAVPPGYSLDVSADGRAVGFRTNTGSIVTGDTNHGVDVFVRPAPGAVHAAYPPSPPRDVTATSGDRALTVRWARPLSTGGGPVTGYRVSVAPASGGAATTVDAAASASSAVVSGLTNGTTYAVTVVASNGIGASDPSDAITVTLAGVPGPPTGVVAGGGDRQLSVSWVAPSSTGGSPITGYTVSAAPASGGAATTVEAGASASSAVVSGLTNGTTYAVTVVARNESGASSPSTPVSATPSTVPGRPTNVGAAGGVRSVSVSWSAPASDGGSAITGYRVTVVPSAGGTAKTVDVGSGARATSVTGLANATTYVVTVAATNAKGSSPPSTSASATTHAPPAAPTGVAAHPGDRQLVVSWTPPSSNGGSPITGYVVHARPWSGEPDVTVAAPAGATSAVVEGLANGAIHWVWVTAYNAAGSTDSLATTGSPATGPGAPLDVAAAPGDGQLTISWRRAPSDGGRELTGTRIVLQPVTGSPATVVTLDGAWHDRYVAQGLANGTTYRVTVFSRNEMAESPPSAPAEGAPGRRPFPPSVTATPANGAVILSWSRPSDGGRPMTEYVIEVAEAGGGWFSSLRASGDATSVVVPGLTNERAYSFKVLAANLFGWSDYSSAVSAVPHDPTERELGRSGYWLLDAAAGVYPFGDARPWGQGAVPRGSRAVDIEPTPSGRGYWVLTDTGEVYGFGDARYLGGAAGWSLGRGERTTSLSATPSGDGYWIFTSHGRVLTFGGAGFFGDMSGVALNGPVLGSIPTPTGRGYYMVASDGGIFTFGDAVFRGSMGDRRLNAPVQALVPSPSGLGYWLVAADGGIFTFGDAPFRGSMGGTPLNQPVVGMVSYGDGYLMVASDGGIFTFSDRPFSGSLGGNPPGVPVTAVAQLGG